MTTILGDTSGWGNLLDPTQPHHAQATSLYRTLRQEGNKVITTNYIIAELMALLTSPLRMPRPALIAFIESIKSSPHVEFIHIDQTLDVKAWQLLKNRPDKEWNLVDCSSFVLMQQRGILEALTTDHHFEQAGFVRLLK